MSCPAASCCGPWTLSARWRSTAARSASPCSASSERAPNGASLFFIGGGFLEVAGRSTERAGPNVQLWLQVRDVDATHAELVADGVEVLRPPTDEPWGLREMWVVDPDGVRIALIEVPADHPMRRR